MRQTKPPTLDEFRAMSLEAQIVECEKHYEELFWRNNARRLAKKYLRLRDLKKRRLGKLSEKGKNELN